MSGLTKKIYIHKNQINLFRTDGFGTSVEEITVRLKPALGWVETSVVVPDRKITLTESQFEEAIRSEETYLKGMPGVIGRIKERFFGEHP